MGEIPNFSQLTWTRNAVETGDFELVVNRALAGSELLAPNRLIEIRRGGETEFVGIVRQRSLVGPGAGTSEENWSVKGPDLLWLLSGRVVHPGDGQEFDVQTGVAAEVAMRHYVNANFLAPSRDFRTEIYVGFDNTAAVPPVGGLVNFSGRFQNLLAECLNEIAVEGNVGHEILLDGASYRYHIRNYLTTDLTFQIDNVAGMEYEEDFWGLSNAVYALGEGQGESRTIELVEDVGSIQSYFRREIKLDVRNAVDLDSLRSAARREIDRLAAKAIAAQINPLVLTGSAQYRLDWDLCHEVLVSIPILGIVFREKIVSVKGELNREQNETFEISVSSERAQLSDVVIRALSRGVPAQVQ